MPCSKDNIATDIELGMNTTAGSFALLGSRVPRDAHVVALLREAGAISELLPISLLILYFSAAGQSYHPVSKSFLIFVAMAITDTLSLSLIRTTYPSLTYPFRSCSRHCCPFSAPSRLSPHFLDS